MFEEQHPHTFFPTIHFPIFGTYTLVEVKQEKDEVSERLMRRLRDGFFGLLTRICEWGGLGLKGTISLLTLLEESREESQSRWKWKWDTCKKETRSRGWDYKLFLRHGDAIQ